MKIEREALKKETDTASKDRLAKLDKASPIWKKNPRP